MPKRMLILAGVLLSAGAAAAQTGAVEIGDAWARATAGKAANGVAYLTLKSPVGDRLTGASTPAAKKAELHTMTMEGGVMKMPALAELDLPPGEEITLKPGATHIMLLGLTAPLREGQSFPLTLQFEKAGAREVTVSVAAPGASAAGKSAGGGMPMPGR